MIRHCVFIRFNPEISDDRKRQLYSEINALRYRLDGVLAFHGGANVSPELGMDKGYSDGFIMDFATSHARDSYLEDAEHQAVGAQLVEAAVGGLEGIFVYDLEMPD